jgi:hypothetical protein
MTRIGILVLIGATLAFAPGTALAEDGDPGKMEYMSNCATCHGLSGKGDGPWPYLKFLKNVEYVPPSLPDLTVLAKNNDGIFPSNRVYEVIDGRAEVRAHGPRLMPIWGVEYSKEAAEYYRSVFRVNDAEAFVSKRIGSLVAYIQSIQGK